MDPPSRISNSQIAAIFYEVADILDLKSVKFKPAAYRRAAHEIETLGEDISTISERGKLEEIPGVGSNLAGKIREILETGRLAHLEKLKQEIPKGVLELCGNWGHRSKKSPDPEQRTGHY